MNCPNCYAPCGPADRFCESCGTPLHASAPSDSTPAPPPSPYEQHAGKHTTSQVKGSSVEPAAATPVTAPYASADTVYASAPSAEEASMPVAASAAGAVTYAAAAPQPTGASSKPKGNDPYAAAVNQASDTNGYAGSYAEPVYSEPVYPQATYVDAPPSPYAGSGTGQAPATAFGLAVTSLILGCLGMLSFGIIAIFGIVGIVLGAVAIGKRNKYARDGLYDPHNGTTFGLGVAGIVTNAVAILVFCALLAIGIAVSEDESSFTYDSYSPAGIEQYIELDS